MLRDNLQGTPYDRTKALAAGPFGSPDYLAGGRGERYIGNGGMGYSWVSQARSYLPNPVGGVIWFGVDAPRSCCYVPFYVGIEQTPVNWRSGDFTKFSLDCPRWIVQAIDTFSMLKYNQMHADVRLVFDEMENEQFEQQPKIEKVAAELYKQDPNLARDFLTRYSSGKRS